MYTQEERCITENVMLGKTKFFEDFKEAIEYAKNTKSYSYEVFDKKVTYIDDEQVVRWFRIGWAIPK